MSDDGTPDPALAAAVLAWRDRPGRQQRAAVLAALARARVFVAVAARAVGTETSEATGLRQESSAEMSLLSVAGADGARALPAFTDGHAVQRWRAEARPVPVAGPAACAAAVDDGAVALLLDPGTADLVLDAGELQALAAGEVPVPGSRLTTRATSSSSLGAPSEPAGPELLAALAEALADEPVTAARLLAGPAGPVLGVVVPGAPDAAALASLADRVARRLGPRLPADGLDLTLVPATGPGQPVPLRQRHRFSLRR